MLDERSRDHSVPHYAIDAIFVAARAFLPQAMRDAIDVHSSRNFRGYVPTGFKGSGVPLRQLEAFQIMLDLGPDALGVHHQTVQRCVERALAHGPMAALDDRQCPGKEPTITAEARRRARGSCRRGPALSFRSELATLPYVVSNCQMPEHRDPALSNA